MDKRIQYLQKSRERQREKYFSLENIQKRREKGIKYTENFLKKQQKGLKKFSDKMIALHEEDAKFYEGIWKNRKHYCENCGKFLGNNFKDIKGKIIVYRYAHIIPKSIYPYLRHYSKNILLLCLNCHTNFDNLPKNMVENMNCYDGELIEELKQLHKKLEQDNNTIYK